MKNGVDYVKIGAVGKDCERSPREKEILYKEGKGEGAGHGQVHTVHVEELEAGGRVLTIHTQAIHCPSHQGLAARVILNRLSQGLPSKDIAPYRL